MKKGLRFFLSSPPNTCRAEDGTYDARLYFNDYWNPGSFLSTLTDDGTNFWVNGWASGGLAGTRVFTPSGSVTQPQTTTALQIGLTYRHLGYDFSKTTLFSTLNGNAATQGMLTKYDGTNGGFPLTSVVGLTTAFLPYLSTAQPGGFWFQDDNTIWIAGEFHGTCFFISLLAQSWMCVACFPSNCPIMLLLALPCRPQPGSDALCV